MSDTHDSNCENRPGGEYDGKTLAGRPIPCHCVARADGRARADREIAQAQRNPDDLTPEMVDSAQTVARHAWVATKDVSEWTALFATGDEGTDRPLYREYQRVVLNTLIDLAQERLHELRQPLQPVKRQPTVREQIAALYSRHSLPIGTEWTAEIDAKLGTEWDTIPGTDDEKEAILNLMKAEQAA
jgi:hypothetical protein